MNAKKKRRLPRKALFHNPDAPSRGKTVHLRVTDDEYADLAARAKLAKLTLSELVRECLRKTGTP